MWANISARRCERTYSRQVGFRHWGFSEVQKKEGTESELLNGSRESDGFSHNQAYRAFQRDGLQVLPPSFSKPSFRFLFAEDVAPYACEKLARHKGGKERLGVLRVGPEIGD